MRLTQKQQWLIARYLREVGGLLGDVSEATRDHVLSRLRNRIHRMIREAPQQADDLAVQRMLASLGRPEEVAVAMLEERGGGDGLALATDDCVWLGVCGGLATYFGIDVRNVRALALVYGITGPLALITYLALYFEMYLTSEDPEVPRIEKVRVAKYFLGSLAAAVLLHIATRVFLYGIQKAYLILLARQVLPPLEGWGWLPLNTAFLLFCVLLVTLPLALLSALPLKNRWGETGTRVVQAMLGVYALTLCFGVACYAVGLILNGVREFLA